MAITDRDPGTLQRAVFVNAGIRHFVSSSRRRKTTLTSGNAMRTILVTGGTGHLGRDLVRYLVSQGRRLRLFSLRPGTDESVEWAQGDLATGDGLPEAMRGVGAVLHAATLSPIARRGIRLTDFFSTPTSVDIEGTRRLLEAASSAGVEHFVFVSIVGLEASSLPYARAKLAGERLVRDSRLPWSVVRATPFYYLMAQMLSGYRRLPIWPLPSALTNPVDTTDVARYLGECLDDGKRGMREEIGGPETMCFHEFGRQFTRVHRLRRLVVPVPVPERAGRAMGFVRTEGRRGTKKWSAWLNEQRGQG